MFLFDPNPFECIRIRFLLASFPINPNKKSFLNSQITCYFSFSYTYLRFTYHASMHVIKAAQFSTQIFLSYTVSLCIF